MYNCTSIQSLSTTELGAFVNLPTLITSVMIYHRGASLSEQHTDLLCTKQDLSHTSRFLMSLHQR